MDYVSMVENEVFFLEQAQRQEAMKRYIKECQILATGKNIPYKLNALNEDLKESLTGLWQKIKTIFNRIWLKFLENLDRFVKSDADYLKSYQNIILNKKAPDVNWTMPDYDTLRKRCYAGTPDFNQYIDPAFIKDMADGAIKATNNENADELKDGWKFAIHARFCKVDGIKENLSKDDDFNAIVKEYFSGGEDQDFAADSLNMTDLYNTCYSSETIISELKKTQVKYNKWIEDVERTFNAKYKEMNALVEKEKAANAAADASSEKAGEAVANGDTEAAKQHLQDTTAANDAAKASREEINKTLANDKTLADETKQKQAERQVQNHSYNLYSAVYNTVLSEAKVSSNGSSDSSSSGGGPVKGNSSNDTANKGVSTAPVNSQAKSAAEASRKVQAAKAADTATGAGIAAHNKAVENGGLDESKLQEFSTNVTTYSTIATETITTIFGAKCNGITKMRNDYMQIIRYHVKYWLGKPDDSDDNVKTQTATPSPNIKQAASINTNNNTKTPGINENPTPTA